MPKLDQLTPQQWRSLRRWRDRWWRIGCSCEPADRKRAEKALTGMYAAIKEPSPRFLWVDSPATACLAVSLFRRAGREAAGDSLRDSLWDSLRASLWDSLRDSLWDSLGASLRASLGASLGDSLWASLGASLGDSLWDSLRASLRASLWDSLGDSLWASLGASLGENAWNVESYWIAYYGWCRKVAAYQPDADTKLSLHQELAESAGWVWAYKRLCVVTERPTAIRWDSDATPDFEKRVAPRLHCETAPAVSWRDGWAVYAINGVRVPELVVMRPAEITLQMIESERNAEVRRIMRERYGEGRYLADTGAKLIDTDTVPVSKVDLRPRCLVEDKDGRRFLVGTDGSTRRVYFMPVPRECQTCEQAHNALSGLDESRCVAQS